MAELSVKTSQDDRSKDAAQQRRRASDAPATKRFCFSTYEVIEHHRSEERQVWSAVLTVRGGMRLYLLNVVEHDVLTHAAGRSVALMHPIVLDHR